MKDIKKAPTKGAVERIAELEKTVQGILQVLNQTMMQSNQRINDLAEVVNALSVHVGTETVEKLVDQEREKRFAEQRKQAEEALLQQVQSGKLVQTDVVSEQSLIVGVEYDQEGKSVPPGRVQVAFNAVLPDLRPKLLGQTVGARVETAGKTYFELLEIYNPQ